MMMGFCLYAASAYITSAVSKEMKGYVPATVWTQWAQERGEWRGAIEQRVKMVEDEQKRMREQIQEKLFAMDKKQDVQSASLTSKIDSQISLLNDLRETLRSHMQDRKP